MSKLVTLYGGPLDGATVEIEDDQTTVDGDPVNEHGTAVYLLGDDGRFAFDHYGTDDEWREAIERELKRVEDEARRQGFDIGRGSDM